MIFCKFLISNQCEIVFGRQGPLWLLTWSLAEKSQLIQSTAAWLLRDWPDLARHQAIVPTRRIHARQIIVQKWKNKFGCKHSLFLAQNSVQINTQCSCGQIDRYTQEYRELGSNQRDRRCNRRGGLADLCGHFCRLDSYNDHCEATFEGISWQRDVENVVARMSRMDEDNFSRTFLLLHY